MADLLKHPENTYESIAPYDPDRPDLPFEVTQEAEIMIKYDGYISREIKEVARFHRLEEKRLPEDVDYSTIHGLRIEAQQKLNKLKPESVGQASRISGVSPADISVLLVYLEQRRYHTDNLQK